MWVRQMDRAARLGERRAEFEALVIGDERASHHHGAIGPLLAHNVDAMSATRTATAAADAQCLTHGPQQRCRQAYRDRLSISF